MTIEERIELIKKKVVAERVYGNEKRMSDQKKAKKKMLSTEPNFFVASNSNGFIVMHLEEFMKLSKAKQTRIIENYK